MDDRGETLGGPRGASPAALRDASPAALRDTNLAALRDMGLAALRDEAARLWHAGRAEEAARLYARAASEAPEAWPDLLRQGHALRAAGAGEAALAAYAAAAADAPGEPLPHLHRGHALRLLGRGEAARKAYGIAVALGPGDPAAAEAEAGLQGPDGGGEGPPGPSLPPRPAEAAGVPAQSVPAQSVPAQGVPAQGVPAPEAAGAALRAPTRLAPPPRRRMAMLRPSGQAAAPAPARGGGGRAAQAMALAFDVTDLLLHFGRQRTLTGIQRVQAGLVGAALRAGRPADYLTFEPARAAWRAVPPEDLGRLLDAAAAGADTEDPAWIAAREAVPDHAPGLRAHAFAEGAVLVNLGNSWGIPGYFRGLRAARGGPLYIPFLHDCVPLVMPEHCVRVLVQDYARWFAAVGVHAQGIICNSASTRADGRRFLDALLPGLDLPMEVLPLDADPRGSVPPDPSALDATRAPRPPEPYVLFVATIESRKDHLTVFRAWLTLLRRHGPSRIPRLVCVGAEGWHAQAALGLLEGSPELSRHVVLLHRVPDGALAALYRDCLLTVYNSHHEGWGLPVTESRAWGKVPVVPRHSGLAESGAGAAVFVDPQSEASMVEALERLLFRPGALAAAEAALAAQGPPRPWSAVLDQLLGQVEAIARAEVPAPAARIALPLGLRLPLGRSDALRPDLAAALADLARDGPGWGLPEPWGVPLTGGAARLRLPLPPGTAGAMRLHLEIRFAGGPVRLALFADSLPAGTATIDAPPEGDLAAAVGVEVGEGTAVLELELKAPAGSGLRGLMLCREDDLSARLDFLEAQRLPPVRPDWETVRDV